MFRVAPPLELKKLEAIFRHKVFKMLLKKGKITEKMIRMLSAWKHSGFNVFCGNRISPKDETAMENLARYIIRASFSQDRMRYLENEGKVIYTAKDGKTSKNFPAMEWLAAMCSHIPNRGEQMVRYYGYYSNVSRGKRKEAGTDDANPCILEPEGNAKSYRKSWARLIQKIYQVDPLVCPKCQGITSCALSASSKLSKSSGISSRIWGSGLSGQGHRLPVPAWQTGRKSVPPSHYPNPKPPIPTRILHINTPTPMPTRNTPGMIIYSHNAITHLKT